MVMLETQLPMLPVSFDTHLMKSATLKHTVTSAGLGFCRGKNRYFFHDSGKPIKNGQNWQKVLVHKIA